MFMVSHKLLLIKHFPRPEQMWLIENKKKVEVLRSNQTVDCYTMIFIRLIANWTDLQSERERESEKTVRSISKKMKERKKKRVE